MLGVQPRKRLKKDQKKKKKEFALNLKFKILYCVTTYEDADVLAAPATMTAREKLTKADLADLAFSEGLHSESQFSPTHIF